MKHPTVRLATILFLIPLFWINITFSQQSAYVIADINAPGNTPIQAYALQDNTIAFQAEYGVPNWGNGAVGLGIDPEAAFLFVTYENSDVIQLLDATTMSNEGTTTAPGAFDLSGIVYDITNTHVYTVDRQTPHLYSYTWDAPNKTLSLDEQIDLTDANAWGIFLDEQSGLLYVANSSTITYYNTDDWTLEGTLSDLINPGVINIEKNLNSNYLYYGGAFAQNNYLTKYDLNTGDQIDVFLGYGSGVMGMTINQQTGMLYITTGQDGDRIRVYDADLNFQYETGDIGNPTDIATASVAYNPLNFMIERDVECVVPGENIEYSLCYENEFSNDAANVVIIADIPSNTNYVSASNGGSYNSNTEEVIWSIGNVAGGSAQSCVTLEISVSTMLPVPSSLLFEAGLNADNIGSMQIGEVIVTDTAETCDIPIAIMSGDTTICLNGTAELPIYLQGIPPWEIVYSDGTNDYTISDITQIPFAISVSPTSTTSYNLISVLGGNGMSSEGLGSASVVVNPIPYPEISGLDSVCAYDQGIIYLTQNHSGDAYTWDIINGNVANGQNTNNISINWLNGTNASVNVIETIIATGCYNTYSFPVTLHHKPMIDFITNDTALCPLSDTLMLCPSNPGQNYTLEWTCSDVSSPWHGYTGDTIHVYTTGVGFYFATYYLNIVNDKGCWNEESAYVVFDFSACEPYITEIDSAAKIAVYPNPFKDELNIEINTKEIEDPLNVILANELGKIIYQEEIEFSKGRIYLESISIPDLSSGTYFLNIRGQNIYLVKKIIKE